jgi:hypothetical protein
MRAQQANPSRTPGWITKQVVGTGLASIAAAVMSTYDPLVTQDIPQDLAIGDASFSTSLGSKLVPAMFAVSEILSDHNSP